MTPARRPRRRPVHSHRGPHCRSLRLYGGLPDDGLPAHRGHGAGLRDSPAAHGGRGVGSRAYSGMTWARRPRRRPVHSHRGPHWRSLRLYGGLPDDGLPARRGHGAGLRDGPAAHGGRGVGSRAYSGMTWARRRPRRRPVHSHRGPHCRSLRLYGGLPDDGLPARRGHGAGLRDGPAARGGRGVGNPQLQGYGAGAAAASEASCPLPSWAALWMGSAIRRSSG
ncbi:MAG: hypothetical protein IANPNBLG_04333 [Bryobacteraceae bacterium]|nr:hypothetical protein [Bryobacteraceae bacterium]